MVKQFKLLSVPSLILSFLSSPFIVSLHSMAQHSLQRVSTDSLDGKGVTWIPKTSKYTGVLIWLHGLGDTADGWASEMPRFSLSNTKIILPTATNKQVTINGGIMMPAWSDLLGLNESSDEDEHGFEQSSNRIKAIINNEIETHGISPSKIIVAGFSQGGAVALHTALRFDKPLGGCIALSTWLPLRSDYPAALSESSRKLKILQIHGNEDRVVNHKWGYNSHEILKQLIPSPEPQFYSISGMGHSSSSEEMDLVNKFIQTILD